MCEFSSDCPYYNSPEADESLKEKFCKGNNLNCACYMVATALGVSKVPADLKPEEKPQAYGIIAQG